ncbi:unnamed protein product [Diamesa serratosioi]
MGFLARNKCAVGVVSVVAIAVVVGIVLAVTLTQSSSKSDDKNDNQNEKTFTIDYEADTFMMDGKPFRYVAGSFHYFRALPQTWREKFKTMRAAGLNAVDLYVQWSLHNPQDGVYNWDGIADVEEFIRLASAEGLYIILRPGPYVCAEIDNGGLPYWLATKYPGIQVRSSDADYQREVEKWYAVLMPKFRNHLYGNGGKIIMVQVENEYGAFKTCDKKYKEFLRDETKKYTEDKAVLFTTDRPLDNELKCGQIDNVFVTTDFGIASASEVEYNFARLREVQPNGPLVNSEFYTGWLTHWQEPNARRSSFELSNTLRTMLDPPYSANVNFYMFFGGTNFGFWAGANDWGIGKYMADITSYDYDAPLDEAGDPTPKYYNFMGVISEYLTLPSTPVPDRTPKGKYATMDVQAINSILSTAGRMQLGSTVITSSKLMTFEQLNQFSGFVLYEADLPKFTRDPANLVVEKLRDRAQVYIDGKSVGVLSRENNIKSLPITASFGKRVQILVENQGRINFQTNFDFKGILGNVTVQTFEEPYYKELTDWTITGFPFEDYTKIESFVKSEGQQYQLSKNGWLRDGPVVFHGEFEIAAGTVIHDTWWNTSGWGKGVLFINGFNLGRYWPLVGPQITMYIPKDLLKRGTNTFVILEQQKAPLDRKIYFSDEAIFME